MSNIGGFLYVYALSAALIIGALATGVYLARRGKRRGDASTMACGIIIRIDKESASDALVHFDLSSLDAYGNIALFIDPDPQIMGDEMRRSVRFEPSSYVLTKDGRLERVKDEKREES